MTKNEIYEQLNLIFRDAFDDDSIVVTETTTANDIEDWDSLAHITLIVTIEKQFKLRFSMVEVANFKNVGDMATSIESKIK